jgi:hypothetical protein
VNKSARPPSLSIQASETGWPRGAAPGIVALDNLEEPIMNFRISGLSPEPFRPLYGLTDEELSSRGVERWVADKQPGFPDRIGMRDVEIGERVLLLNHVCQPADTPYRATHAIFVHEGAETAFDRVGEVPEVMKLRVLSLRAYDAAHMMIDADLAEGDAVEPLIRRLLGNPGVAYIHAHYAKRGCYSGRIERA